MDNKQITIIAVCGMLMLLLLVFACSKGCGSKNQITKQPKTTHQTFTTENIDKEIKETYSTSHSYSSRSYSSGSGRPPALLTEEDIKKLKKRREKSLDELSKNAIEWLKEKTNDSRLDPKTIEKYKLKSNENFVKASNALNRKEYKTAIKLFNDTIKDPNSSAVTKFFALQNLMTIAYETKDLDLYFIAARMNAVMCAKEDLSVLGIKKSDHQLNWVDKVENSIKARNDPKYFEECVKMKMVFYKYGINRIEAEREVRKDIKLYTNLYKELIE